MHALTRYITLGTLVLAAACGGSGDPSSPIGGTGTTTPPGSAATTNGVAVLDNRFNPTVTTVIPGTTVTWTWGGSASHNVTFDDGAPSTSMTSGTFTRAAATAGTFDYRCTIHGAAMSGTVVVT